MAALDLSNCSPEEMSVVLQQVQQAFLTKDQTIKELQYIQNPLLHSKNWSWTTTLLPPELHNMRRSADAVTDDTGDNIFLRRVNTTPPKLYQHCISSHQWQEVGQCSNYRSSLAVFNNQLMLIGGACTREDKSQRSQDVLCRAEGMPFRLLTSMPTRRSRTTALTFTSPGIAMLIVIGGEDDNDATLKTVEIMDLVNGEWYKAQDTPEPLCCSSGTIVNGHIYLLGGWTKRNTASSEVFSCKVEDLLRTCQAIEAGEHLLLHQIAQFLNPSQNIWETLPDLPVFEATCTSFINTLIVVGGVANNVAVHDIRTYNSGSKRWEVIGYLPHARYLCFAVGLPDKLVVIGGKKDSTTKENTIEIFQKN